MTTRTPPTSSGNGTDRTARRSQPRHGSSQASRQLPGAIPQHVSELSISTAKPVLARTDCRGQRRRCDREGSIPEGRARGSAQLFWNSGSTSSRVRHGGTERSAARSRIRYGFTHTKLLPSGSRPNAVEPQLGLPSTPSIGRGFRALPSSPQEGFGGRTLVPSAIGRYLAWGSRIRRADNPSRIAPGPPRRVLAARIPRPPRTIGYG